MTSKMSTEGSFRSTFDLLLATELEAKPILADEDFKWLWDKGLGCYFDQKCGHRLWVTGIGPTRSAYFMGKNVEQMKGGLINLGVVGALGNFELAKMLRVDKVYSDHDHHPFIRKDDVIELDSTSEESSGDFEVGCVISVGKAVHDEVNKTRLAKVADVVDMELYALATCAKWSGRSLRSYKIISDFASEADAKMIVKRIPELMKCLWGNLSL